MSRPIDQFTTHLQVGPNDQPGVGFSVRWIKEERKLQFTGSFPVARLLQALAAKGYIDIKQLPEGEDQYQTIGFDLPIRDEQALRMLAFGESASITSLLMGIASDLAKVGK